ncbi:MAG: acetamidase/formamidase family protein [Methylocystaceae bacterium]
MSSGDRISVTTMDCFANQLQTPEDTLETMDWDRVNPATGPIYVDGAKGGEVLKVHIERIAVGNQGIMATGENEGVLGAHMQGLISKVVPIKNDQVIFDEKLSIPIKPMIGVIGVAPSDEEVNCGTPGSHGGNMDNTMVAAGATLYFPVYVNGALLALGDVHAVMGDGEIGVSGVEVPAEVTLRVETVRGLGLDNPVRPFQILCKPLCDVE